jgi:hypothetical protein
VTGRQPDEYYIALERRLRALEPEAEAVLAPDPYRWFKDYLDAGEYGLAVEVALEELPDERHPAAARALAAALRREAEAMRRADDVKRRP